MSTGITPCSAVQDSIARIRDLKAELELEQVRMAIAIRDSPKVQCDLAQDIIERIQRNIIQLASGCESVHFRFYGRGLDTLHAIEKHLLPLGWKVIPGSPCEDPSYEWIDFRIEPTFLTVKI